VDVRVRFQPSGRCVEVAAGSTLLAAARQVGLPLASACDGGALCGRCGVTLLSDARGLSPESPAEARAKRRNRIEAGQRLACRATVSSDVEVTASYW
jgi:2Fe-2S ferredoxin